MSIIRAGSAHLSCRLLLEHPRSLPRRPNAIFFDAVIFCPQDVQSSERINCSLRYLNRCPQRTVPAGVYDVFAKIVSARTNSHPPSCPRSPPEFTFMGEILQLRDVPHNEMETFHSLHFPMRINAAGRVTAIEQGLDVFALTVWQLIARGNPLCHLTLRAVLPANSASTRSNMHVPSTDSVVSFTGNIICIDDDIVSVAIDDLTYLPFVPNDC